MKASEYVFERYIILINYDFRAISAIIAFWHKCKVIINYTVCIISNYDILAEMYGYQSKS